MKISAVPRINLIDPMLDAHPARLISECIAGNQDAIAAFVHQHETGIFRLALSIVGDQAEASEITQETFSDRAALLPRTAGC